MKNSFVLLMALCSASALAMPTKSELAKVQLLVEELMADDVAAYKAKSKKAEEIGNTSVKYAKEASTEAAKFLLLKGAISYYVRGESYDKAADAVNALREAIPDVPPDVLEEIIRKNTARVTAKKAPRLYAIYRTVQVQMEAAKVVRVAKAALAKKPKDEAAIRKLAEAQALSGDWKAALATFAKMDSKAGTVAKSETDGKDLPTVADFWWDYESYLGEDDADAFKAHAAAIYRKCLADGSIDGLKKNIVEKRIKGYAEPAKLVESGEEKQLTYEGYLPETNTLLWEGVSVDAIREFTATFAGKHVTKPAKVVGYVVKSGKGWKEVQFQLAEDAFLKCIHAKFVQKGDAVCGSAVKAECADSSVAPGTDFAKIKSVQKYWLCFSDKGEGYGIKDLVVTVGGKGATQASATTTSSTGSIELKTGGDSPFTVKGNEATLTLTDEAKIEFIKCPAGTYTMGYEDQVGPYQFHKVRITRPFWLMRYLLTCDQWRSFMKCEDTFIQNLKEKDLTRMRVIFGGGKTPACPSYLTMQELLGRLNAEFKWLLPPGYVFRLPTEAEWEYACKAGAPSSDPYAKRIWNAKEVDQLTVSAEKRLEMLREKGVDEKLLKRLAEWPCGMPAMPVGVGKPNRWGFYDMIGSRHQYTLDVICQKKEKWPDDKLLKDIRYETHGVTVDPLMRFDGANDKKSAAIVCGDGWCCSTMKWAGSPLLKSRLGIDVPRERAFGEAGLRIAIGPDLVSEWKAKNAKK